MTMKRLACFALFLLAAWAQAQTLTFSDDFSSGKLGSKWIASRWSGAGNIPGKNKAIYDPNALDFSQGMLRIKLVQKGKKGTVHSTGGEIISKHVFGYGTYTFVMRMSSTAARYDEKGDIVDGSISAGWNYLTDSKTEIDFEFRSDKPDRLLMTHYVDGTRPVRQSKFKADGLADGFHKYVFVWAPGRITWYLDDEEVATHTQDVPTTPAHIMLSHWGTNDDGFGGKATVGVPRYMYVKSVSFTPLGIFE
jgi:endo-1,3-1,4-beta-glycanase ExoK